MLLTNHALTGSLIGLATGSPVAAAPLGVGSHFLMDSLPHFGLPGMSLKKMPGVLIGAVDFTLALCVTSGLALAFPERAPAQLAGAIGAMLPDLFYIPDILFGVRFDPAPVRAFHHNIQQGKEFPLGILIDIAWASAVIMLLVKLLRP